METVVDIGQELARRRRALGISQSELGARVGVLRQQIQRWEANGYRTTSLERVGQVAEALGWRPVDVCAGAAHIAAETRASYGAAAEATRPVRDLGEVVARIRDHADELRRRFGVTSIGVFGSFARGEQTDQSDVDLIVELEHPTPETAFGAERQLGEILGRRVESGSLSGANPRVRPQILRELVDVWRA